MRLEATRLKYSFFEYLNLPGLIIVYYKDAEIFLAVRLSRSSKQVWWLIPDRESFAVRRMQDHLVVSRRFHAEGLIHPRLWGIRNDNVMLGGLPGQVKTIGGPYCDVIAIEAFDEELLFFSNLIVEAGQHKVGLHA